MKFAMFSYFLGFSLLEVLISLFILSFALLGFEAMELHAFHETHSAFLFNIAMHQMANMSERLRVSDSEEALDDLIEEWNQQNQMLLPKGYGRVMGDFPTYTIFIFWGNVSHVNCKEILLGSSGCIKEKISF
jgi:hypothetical protein